MRYRRRSRLLWLMKPLSVMVLLLSLFALVWLRSGVVSIEYRLSELEKTKRELMRDKKVLAAEKARLLSVARFEQGVAEGFAFPDRVKVVHVMRGKGGDTY